LAASRCVSARAGLASALVLAAPAAQASMFSGDALDAVANGISWFVLCVVPIGLIALFWMVHVLPEKIAHKRHHPQTKAIQVLCLLSLFFGGLLWPLAWLWAYTRPTAFRAAYGTDKHEDYHTEMGGKARAGQLLEHEIAHLRDELDAMKSRGALPPELLALRVQLDALPVKPATPVTAAAAAEGAA
jgi:CBS domain containing-hemolysin-like protein